MKLKRNGKKRERERHRLGEAASSFLSWGGLSSSVAACYSA